MAEDSSIVGISPTSLVSDSLNVSDQSPAGNNALPSTTCDSMTSEGCALGINAPLMYSSPSAIPSIIGASLDQAERMNMNDSVRPQSTSAVCNATASLVSAILNVSDPLTSPGWTGWCAASTP